MRLLKIIGLFIFVSCNDQANQTAISFKRIIPDTTKTWAGQRTRESYQQTRIMESKLGLQTLVNGANYDESRIWYMSDSYNNQVVFIIKKDSSSNWKLRTISFYKNQIDSIYADYTRLLRIGAVESLVLQQYWNLPSQSDLKSGDSFGCYDGENIFIEMANREKYRFMWHNCPEINKGKDSVFLLVSELVNKLDGLAVEH